MSRTAVPFATALSAALLAAGCVMPDQVSQLQKDVADVRQQLRQVKEDQARSLEKLDQLEANAARPPEQGLSREQLAELTFRVEESARNTEISVERLNDLDRRIERLTRELEQTRDLAARAAAVPAPTPLGGEEAGPRPRPPVSSDPAVPDPETLYNTAYADFSKGNYALAISGFEEYEDRFPDSALADNARYWIGECHFSQGAFDDALRSFDLLLERYPESDKAAAANLKKALAYREGNQTSQAIIQFRYVVTEYPTTDEAKIARTHLASLGAPI